MRKPSQTLIDSTDKKLSQLYIDIRRLEVVALTYNLNLDPRFFNSLAVSIEIEQRNLRDEHSRADS